MLKISAQEMHLINQMTYYFQNGDYIIHQTVPIVANQNSSLFLYNKILILQIKMSMIRHGNFEYGNYLAMSHCYVTYYTLYGEYRLMH